MEFLRTLYPVGEGGNVITIVHGDCRGADKTVGEVAESLGFDVIAVPAAWEQYGKGSGPIRNMKMFDENKPFMVLAFHSDIENSKGTKHMIGYARKNGCPVRLVTK